MNIVGAYVAIHHSSGPFSRLIAWISAPRECLAGRFSEVGTHAAQGFIADDGTKVYFEALEGAGFRGPLPDSEAVRWAERKRGRWVRRYQLNVTADEAKEIWDRAQDQLGSWKYSIIQLLLMYLNLRFRVPLSRTPGRVICSEAVGRLTSPILDLRGAGKTFDETTPYDLQNSLGVLGCPLIPA